MERLFERQSNVIEGKKFVTKSLPMGGKYHVNLL